jgi:uncharacterized protein (DUF305 family)
MIIKNIFLIASTLFMSVCFLSSCDKLGRNVSQNKNDNSMPHMIKDSTHSGMMQSMSRAMNMMTDLKMTGDFDLDFANMMIIHHQAAIEMSEKEISDGADRQLIGMAQNIITAQQEEIVQLQQFSKDHNMPEVELKGDEKSHKLIETMNAMMDKMNTMQMTGDPDKDFVRMMIPHHESAVTMAKDELMYGKNSKIKAMAKKMRADQSKEIDAFNTWLTRQESSRK